MSQRIRMDTEELKRQAEKLKALAAAIKKSGDAVAARTSWLKDYGGQLPTKKFALSTQQTASAIFDQIQADAEHMAHIADLFEKVDSEVVEGMEIAPPPPFDPPNFKIFSPNATMQSSRCGVRFLARHEDVDKPFYPLYNDAAGNCTAGIGHLVHKKPCTPEDYTTWGKQMTKDKALELLQQDVQKAEEIVKKAITGVKLTQAQFDALVSLAYNLGNIPEDVADAVNTGNFEEAGTLMQKYVHGSDGLVYTGLVKRRADEAALMLTGMYGDECVNPPENSRENFYRNR
jgi:GH24 family phage-related lysozyme (muramidase)